MNKDTFTKYTRIKSYVVIQESTGDTMYNTTTEACAMYQLAGNAVALLNLARGAYICLYILVPASLSLDM